MVRIGKVNAGFGKSRVSLDGERAEVRERERALGLRLRQEEVDLAGLEILLVGDTWNARADRHGLGAAEETVGIL